MLLLLDFEVHLEMAAAAIGMFLEMAVAVIETSPLRDGGVRLEVVPVAIGMLLLLDGEVHLEMAAAAIGMFLGMAVAVIEMSPLRDDGVRLEMAVVANGMLRLEMAVVVVVIGMLLLRDGVQVEMGDNVVVSVTGRHEEKTHAVRHKVSTVLKTDQHQDIEIEVGLGSPIIEIEVVIGPGSPIAELAVWTGIGKDTRQLLLLRKARYSIM
jgi:hypothetical protein